METQPIPIESELYDRVRRYCDQSGIRFKDFVENALESAMDQEGLMRMVEKAGGLIERVGRECRSAYQQGFRSGLLAGVLAAQGKMGLFENCSPPETREKGYIFRSVEGPQKKMFD